MARIEFRCKEETKELIKHHAEKRDMSVTTYIKNAVLKELKKDGKKED